LRRSNSIGASCAIPGIRPPVVVSTQPVAGLAPTTPQDADIPA
jgi:hypothetical protein